MKQANGYTGAAAYAGRSNSTPTSAQSRFAGLAYELKICFFCQQMPEAKLMNRAAPDTCALPTATNCLKHGCHTMTVRTLHCRSNSDIYVTTCQATAWLVEIHSNCMHIWRAIYKDVDGVITT
jgi:hypothetical protein